MKRFPSVLLPSAATALALGWLLCSDASAIAPASPAPTPDAEEQAAVEIVRSFHPQEGKVALAGGIADLNLPTEFRYLNAQDTRKLLVDLWGNPPNSAEGILGMIIPTGFNQDAEHSWAATISYSERGYVKDEEPDYDALLKQLQAAQEKVNPERVKEGYAPAHLVGWAQPPRYDKETKKLYWAKELDFEGQRQHTLNYDIRILGRRGTLELSVIAGINQLAQINNVAPSLLSTVEFNQGHRYADFNPKTDKTAAYGLAGLIGGGLVLAKVGGFGKILALLVAAKKFLVVGVVAVVGFFKRVFGGGTKVNTDRPGPPTGTV